MILICLLANQYALYLDCLEEQELSLTIFISSEAHTPYLAVLSQLGPGTTIAKGILRYFEVCIHSGGMEGFLTTFLQKKAMASD